MIHDNNKQRLPFAASLIALALAAALAACGDKRADAAEDTAPPAPSADHGVQLSAQEAQRAGIRLEAASAQPVADGVTVTATIHANQDRLAHVAPRVEGRVISVQVRLGDTVKAGQLLAMLDSMAVGEAAAAWALARAEHRVAKADFDRAEGLNADEIIPQKDYLRARSDFEKASAALQAGEDRLKLLGAWPVRGSAVAMSSFPVAAPFKGTIIEKKAIAGELASPADVLFTVADLSRLWIEADLTESSLPRVRVGARAAVAVQAYPGERFLGQVTYVSPVLDTDKRTVPARIEVDNADGRLKPGMFASATIDAQPASAGSRRDALTVPGEAVVLLHGLPAVFVFDETHGSYEPRPIQPGGQLGGRTIVSSGLQAGEQVVAAGAYALKARLLKSQISAHE